MLYVVVVPGARVTGTVCWVQVAQDGSVGSACAACVVVSTTRDVAVASSAANAEANRRKIFPPEIDGFPEHVRPVAGMLLIAEYPPVRTNRHSGDDECTPGLAERSRC